MTSPIPSRGKPTREEIARAHWESERQTLRVRSPGFDAGPWEEADQETRDMRLTAADAILALFPVEAANGSGWRPIKTCPTDNSRVLLWLTGRMLPGLRFGSAYYCEGRVVAKPEGGNGDWTADISHWQPLPSPPLAEGQDHE